MGAFAEVQATGAERRPHGPPRWAPGPGAQSRKCGHCAGNHAEGARVGSGRRGLGNKSRAAPTQAAQLGARPRGTNTGIVQATVQRGREWRIAYDSLKFGQLERRDTHVAAQMGTSLTGTRQPTRALCTKPCCRGSESGAHHLGTEVRETGGEWRARGPPRWAPSPGA